MRCPRCEQSVIVFDVAYQYARCLCCGRSINVIPKSGREVIKALEAERVRLTELAVGIKSMREYTRVCPACETVFTCTAAARKYCDSCVEKGLQARKDKTTGQDMKWHINAGLIRARIRQMGMSQNSFAEAIGTNGKNMSKWLNFSAYPSHKSIKLLSEGLGLGVEEFAQYRVSSRKPGGENVATSSCVVG